MWLRRRGEGECICRCAPTWTEPKSVNLFYAALLEFYIFFKSCMHFFPSPGRLECLLCPQRYFIHSPYDLNLQDNHSVTVREEWREGYSYVSYCPRRFFTPASLRPTHDAKILRSMHHVSKSFLDMRNWVQRNEMTLGTPIFSCRPEIRFKVFNSYH